MKSLLFIEASHSRLRFGFSHRMTRNQGNMNVNLWSSSLSFKFVRIGFYL